MSHVGNLIMNVIRETLEKLSRSGVGRIDIERSNTIYYTIDNRTFRVQVLEMTNEAYRPGRKEK